MKLSFLYLFAVIHSKLVRRETDDGTEVVETVEEVDQDAPVDNVEVTEAVPLEPNNLEQANVNGTDAVNGTSSVDETDNTDGTAVNEGDTAGGTDGADGKSTDTDNSDSTNEGESAAQTDTVTSNA